MVRRKADIFTVAESVVNWFNASSCSIVSTEVPEGIENRAESSDPEPGLAIVTETITIQGLASQQLLPSVQSTTEVPNGVGATPKVDELVEATDPRGHDDVDELGHLAPSVSTESAFAAH